MKKFVILVAILGLVAFTAPAMADTSASANAGSSIDTDSHDVYNNEATEARPNSGPVPIPGQPGWFTQPTPDGDFIVMKNILEFGKIFSEGALENMANGGNTRVTYAQVNPEARVSARSEDDRRIMIIIDPARIKELKATGTHVAFVNGAAKNGKTNSVQLMAAMALKALNADANVILFKAEGAHRKVEAFGWGIGFSYVRATENGMGTGGTGISGGAVGPEDRPWLQGNAFVDAQIQAVLDAL